MEHNAIKNAILSGKTVLGIELGSTRIKAVLLDENHKVIASGDYTWQNQLKNGLWTYELAWAREGVQASYKKLAENVETAYGVALEQIGAIGISGMMHGYLAFDKDGNQLSDFLTWRNTHTTQAADILTKEFDFNIPLRWSIAQFYQAILNKEEHVKDVAYICTLSSYIHWLLTGEKVIGIGEASGMFPIDSEAQDYNKEMLEKFRALVKEENYPWDIADILPKVMVAGEKAGVLTESGAKLLDPSGKLKAGVPMAPPEGDAGTGMVATNSVAVKTGNVSAGTSIFAMVVLEKQLSKLYTEIDMVTTPCGKPVAMVHCNNCSSEFDAWVNLFSQMLTLMGAEVDRGELFTKLYLESLNGAKDCDGVIVYNYLSGEPLTGLQKGIPMLLRQPESKLTLANFLRSQLYSAFAALSIGMEILKKEDVQIEQLMGHGGLFKTPGVAQRYLAAAVQASVSVMETAGEGGAYGMAVLAAYMLNKQNESLADYLNAKIFADNAGNVLAPEQSDIDGFNKYLDMYVKGLEAEKAAVDQYLA